LYLAAPVLHPKAPDWAGMHMGRAATDAGASAGKDRAKTVRPALGVGAGFLEGIDRPGDERQGRQAGARGRVNASCAGDGAAERQGWVFQGMGRPSG
jgi:hypothetical protein